MGGACPNPSTWQLRTMVIEGTVTDALLALRFAPREQGDRPRAREPPLIAERHACVLDGEADLVEGLLQAVRVDDEDAAAALDGTEKRMGMTLVMEDDCPYELLARNEPFFPIERGTGELDQLALGVEMAVGREGDNRGGVGVSRDDADAAHDALSPL